MLEISEGSGPCAAWWVQFSSSAAESFPLVFLSSLLTEEKYTWDLI